MSQIQIKCKAADSLPLDRILEFQGSLKKMSKSSLQKLKRRILEDGFIAPIFCWDDSGEYRAIDGHQRLAALLSLREDGIDIPMLPVAFIEAEDEEEARRRVLSVSSQYGDFDLDELQSWLDDIDSDIAETFRLVDTEIELDLEAPSPEETIGDDDLKTTDIPEVTQEGDLWELGAHRLLCGDSRRAEMVSALMNGDRADFVLTDPPYHMDLETDFSHYGTDTEAARKFKGKKRGNDYEPIAGDNDDFTPELITTIFDNFDYCKEIFLFGADYFIDLLPNYGKDGCLLVWNKRSSDEQQKGIGNTFELFWSKQRHKKYVFNFEWFGFLSKDAPKEARNRLHPSMKPVGLIERIFLWYKLPVGIVVDLYIGSGTTIVACEKTERTCYGMELDPHNCDITVNRYKAWCLENDRPAEIKLNGQPYKLGD